MDNQAINKHMDTKQLQNQPAKQPDEKGGIYLQGHIKIWDPESKEVFVDKPVEVIKEKVVFKAPYYLTVVAGVEALIIVALLLIKLHS